MASWLTSPVIGVPVNNSFSPGVPACADGLSLPWPSPRRRGTRSGPSCPEIHAGHLWKFEVARVCGGRMGLALLAPTPTGRGMNGPSARGVGICDNWDAMAVPAVEALRFAVH